ncbi:DUF2165 family protein [Porphyrobacter algicida]|uniref:DUF2165 family protein n=1 Tax=Qipengyuania algicida TaxID=1836209 RepID=A0A845AFH8_9SPHN|nr:DUF2165 family protein [Qipengyuania algicida]MXP29000.1 DUF2165 family protein [Qipengyuania algicida]
MIDRYLKSLFSLALGVMALFYVAHNIANWAAAEQFFTYTTGRVGHEAYPVDLLPVPSAPMIWVAMLLVFALELGAGVMLVLGAFTLWRARTLDDAKFERAKLFSKIGIGCAVLNWWGLFQGLAVAGFQLWQAPLGAGPFYGSFFFGAMNMMLLIYLSQRDNASTPFRD